MIGPGWASGAAHAEDALDAVAFGDDLAAVVMSVPEATSVAITTVVQGGYVGEPEDRRGYTHLVEHLWFRAPLADGSTVWDALQQRGCRVEAWTEPDLVLYQTTCAASELPFLLELEQRRAGPWLGTVPPAAVEVEVAVLAREAHVRNDRDTRLLRTLHERLWSPEARANDDLFRPLTYGGPTELAEAPPARRSVAIVGPMPREELLGALERAFGAPGPLTPRGEGALDEPFTLSPPFDASPLVVGHLDPFPAAMWGWALRPGGPDFTTDLVAGALEDAWWQQVASSGDVMGIRCTVVESPTHPTLLCRAVFEPGVDTKGRARLEGSLDDAIRSIPRFARRARLEIGREAEDRWLAGAIDPFGESERLARLLHTYGRVADRETIADLVGRFRTTGAVKQIRRALLATPPAALVLVPAEDPVPLVPAAAPPGILATPPPRVAEIPLPADWPAVTATFDNGARLVAVQRDDVALTTATVWIPGGTAMAPFPLAAVADALSAAPAGGTADIDAWAGWAPDHTYGAAVGDGARTRKIVERAIENARYRIPRFDDAHRDVLDRWIERELHAIGPGADGERAAQRLLNGHVLPGHRPSNGLTVEDLEHLRHLEAISLFAWMNQPLGPQDAIVTVTGPAPPEALLASAKGPIAGWNAPTGAHAAGPSYERLRGPPDPVRMFLVDPALPSVRFEGACLVEGGLDEAARRVVVQAADRVSTRELRERRGLVYTPESWVTSWPGATTFHWAVSTDPGLADPVAAAWLDLGHGLVEELRNNLPSLVQTVRGQLAVAHTSVGAYEELVHAVVREGGAGSRPVTHLDRSLAALTPALADRMGACLDRGSVVVSGPTAISTPGFEPATLGGTP